MALLYPNTFFTLAWLSFWTGLAGCTDHRTINHERVQTEALPTLPASIKKATLPRATEKEPQDLILAVVGEVRGELEPCGCPTLPFGGFERRDSLLRQLREDGPGPLFHVDAGDMLIKGFSTQRIDDVKERAHEMLRMSRMVGVDAWVPGSSDLMALSWQEIQQHSGPPPVSATWRDSTGTPVFSPSIVLTKGDIQVGIIGLSAAPPEQSGLQFAPPESAAREALSSIPSSVDWIIGVGNISDDEARELLASVPEMSALFTTKGAVYVEPPEDNTSPPVVETPDRGRFVQVIHTRLATGPTEPLLLHPDKAEWRARLSAMRTQTEDALTSLGAGRNLALVNTIPLSAELNQAGRISDRLQAYQETRRQQAAQRAEDVSPHERLYASSGACVNCHSDEFARWTLTGHARAWLALIERNETKNPECVGCHTTGFGEPGGLGELTAKNIRKFKGVQCEECHGPMKGHPNDTRVESEPISMGTCLGCHDEANSPDFDYSTYLPQASCQGGSPSIMPAPAGQP